MPCYHLSISFIEAWSFFGIKVFATVEANDCSDELVGIILYTLTRSPLVESSVTGVDLGDGNGVTQDGEERAQKKKKRTRFVCVLTSRLVPLIFIIR